MNKFIKKQSFDFSQRKLGLSNIGEWYFVEYPNKIVFLKRIGIDDYDKSNVVLCAGETTSRIYPEYKFCGPLEMPQNLQLGDSRCRM